MSIMSSLLEKEAFLFDLDGCIYFGNKPAPRARELLNFLRKKQKKVMFITNNSTDSVETIKKRLETMEIEVEISEIYHPVTYIGPYLYELEGLTTVKVAGSELLQAKITESGHTILPLHSKERANWIVVGRDTTFSYEKIKFITKDLEQGAQLLKTNPDFYHLNEMGEKVPESGLLAWTVEKLSGKVGQTIGKPEVNLLKEVFREHQLIPDQCVMIGDNLFTDVAGGKRAGVLTVWLKGDQEDPTTFLQPDITVASICELEQKIKTLSKSEV